ncbi:MAG TPA: hypothetical protein VHG51_16630 [Longimicrobiaceae bacterium]|nr:hypothetical protein [Longimicrobiaceae bacterium]
MRILGIMMVRNGASRLKDTLDGMAAYCDSVVALDDRSVDSTAQVLQEHPVVSNHFTANPALSQDPWFFPESMNLDLLYRMADFERPDWVVAADDDVRFEPGERVRSFLSGVDPGVAAIRVRCVSTWNDPEYPLMVPLMGAATSRQGRIWRYRPGLRPGDKPLHNGYLPVNVSDFGEVVPTEEIVCYHDGWDTLRKRIEKVDLYRRLDPECRLNHGVPYDRGLLFGYSREAVDELVGEYRVRLARRQEHDAGGDISS